MKSPLQAIVIYSAILFALLLASTGCNGSGNAAIPTNNLPGSPSPNLTTQALTAQPAVSSHNLWFYNLVYFDPKAAPDGRFEMIPVRGVSDHLNVLGWLQNWPCGNCVKIVKVTQSGNNTLLVDVQIKHPFSNPNLTGFDVRGIAIFNAYHLFPESGLTLSDRILGNGELVNADGYTALYNPATSGHGLEGYLKGKLSTLSAPNALLNGYKRFVTDKPENIRNAFYSGDTIISTYEIALPAGPLVFGYAVDGNWTAPISKPVDDPMVDFGIDANCPEAWKIEAQQVSADLVDCAGSTVMNIDIYDWQGKDDVYPVRLECPELFDGAVQAGWKEDFPEYSRYVAVVENLKNTPEGSYKCLISKEAKENDPGKAWMDISAYQVVTLNVKPHTDLPPTPVIETGQTSFYTGDLIQFDGSKSHDNDCAGNAIVAWAWDWENDGTFDDTGATAMHNWDDPGTYSVVLKVTDDEGNSVTIDPPMELSVVDPNDPPHADAYLVEPLVYVTHTAHFSGEHSYDPDGGSIVKYEWDWENDGIFDSEGMDAYHTWDTTGTYYVQLRVTDDESDTDILYTPLEVVVHPLTPPIAQADCKPNPGFVGQLIYLYDLLSYDPDGGQIQLYEWDWEADGVYELAGSIAYHSWASPGTYQVQLRVTDDEGVSSTLSQPLVVTINASNPLILQDVTPPWLNFSPKDVAVDGNYAYVAASGNGLHIFNISNPVNPVWVNQVETGNGILFDDYSNNDAMAVAVQNGYAFVADAYAGFTIVDVDPPQSASVVKNIPLPLLTSDITLHDGYAFLMCRYFSEYVAIVDIDPPEDTHVVKVLDTPGSTHLSIDGDYAYTDGTIRRIDINPVEDAYIDYSFPLQGSGILAANGYAYSTRHHEVPDGNSWDTLVIMDVDPPESAHEVKEMGGHAYGLDMQKSGNILYVGTSGYFSAYDVSTPESPVSIDSYGAGWSRYGGFGLNGDYAYLANGVEGIEVLKIDPVNDISLQSTVFTPGGARDVAVSNGYASIANDLTGLQIYNVNPPETSSFAGAFYDKDNSSFIEIDNDIAYLRRGTGDVIQAIDIATPQSPFLLKELEFSPSNNGRFAIGNGYGYIPSSYNIAVFDIDPIDSAHFFSSIPLGGSRQITLDGNFAYATAGLSGLDIIDISVPGSENVIKTVMGSASSRVVDVKDGFAYVGNYASGAHGSVDIIDIDPVDSAFVVKTIPLDVEPGSLVMSNGYLFAAQDYKGIAVIDATVPESAYVLTEISTPWEANSVEIEGNLLYVTGIRNGDSGLLIYKLW